MKIFNKSEVVVERLNYVLRKRKILCLNNPWLDSLLEPLQLPLREQNSFTKVNFEFLVMEKSCCCLFWRLSLEDEDPRQLPGLRSSPVRHRHRVRCHPRSHHSSQVRVLDFFLCSVEGYSVFLTYSWHHRSRRLTLTSLTQLICLCWIRCFR